MRFKDFLLTEISKQALLNATDQRRLYRAKNEMKVKPPAIVSISSDIEQLHFNFVSYPPHNSTERKNHCGLVEYNPKTKDIIGVYCGCKDFSYRLWYAFTKDKLSTWNLPDYFDKRIREGKAHKNNRQPARITNPNNDLYVCKHLAALLINYFDDTITEPIPTDTPIPKQAPSNLFDIFNFLPDANQALDLIRVIANFRKGVEVAKDDFIETGKELEKAGWVKRSGNRWIPTKKALDKFDYVV